VTRPKALLSSGKRLRTGVEGYAAQQETTEVNLTLKGEDSVFIVFDGQNPLEDTVLNPQRDEVARQSILSPWTVRFDPEYGTAKSIKMQSLTDWKNFDDADIKHYSGSADYNTQFEITDAFFDSADAFTLDLGQKQKCQTGIVKISRLASVNG